MLPIEEARQKIRSATYMKRDYGLVENEMSKQISIHRKECYDRGGTGSCKSI